MCHQTHPSFHPVCRCSSLPFAELRHPIAHRTVVWQKATCRAKPRQPNNPPVSNMLHPGQLRVPPYRGNPFEYASDRKEGVAVRQNQNHLGNHKSTENWTQSGEPVEMVEKEVNWCMVQLLDEQISSITAVKNSQV